MEGGRQRNVLVSIARNGCSDELAVRVEGLPPEVQQHPCLLAPGQEIASLQLEAGIHAECTASPVVLSLWQGQTRAAECDAQLTVTPFRMPVLGAIEPIRLEQGEKRLLRLAVERRDCSAPLRLEVEDLPRGVKQHCIPADRGASTLILELAAVANAAPAAGPVHFQLWTGKDRLGEARKVPFTLLEHRAPPRLLARGPVHLKAGGSTEVLCEMDPPDPSGSYRLRLEGLPTGVDADVQPVPKGSKRVAVPVRAAANARRGDFTITVLALDQEKKAAECQVALAIDSPEPRPAPAPPRGAPRPVTVKEVRARSELVTLSTTDHVLLHARYYRGAQGKTSGCVLLLHDLNKSSADPSWRSLAEKLHARGHTVLALDFRGHGESKQVEPDFWDEPVNQGLTSYIRGAPANAQPRHIEHSDFPGEYAVWLLHDIAAARAFLELKHDNPDEPVNLRNLVIVGAGQGATLGAVWLATESFRYRIRSEPGEPLRWDHNPETEIFAGTIWIGLDLTLVDRRMDNHLVLAGRNARLPMVLLYGDTDQMTRQALRPIFDALQRATSRVGSALLGVPNTGVTRQQLLTRNLKTSDMVCETVDHLVQIRFEAPWARRHFAERYYRWIVPWRGARLIHYTAKKPGEERLRQIPLWAFDMPLRQQARVGPVD
jgi:pimeloyl-ACP methyl ester carboxylesterase